MAKKVRRVDLFAQSESTSGSGFGPPIQPDTPENRLEEMIKIANIMSEQDNNQAGTGKRNNDKSKRAERRRMKLARKKSRYR